MSHSGIGSMIQNILWRLGQALDNGDVCNTFFAETFNNCSATVGLVGSSFGGAIYIQGSGAKIDIVGTQFIGNKACTLGAGPWMC